MKILCVLLILAWTSCAIASDGGQADRPLHGQWDFRPVKAWEVDCAGDSPLDTPAELRVSEDETLYFHDFGRDLSCIFRRDGSFIGSFAAPGDRPGELSRYINCFVIGEKVIVAEPDKLNFYTREGQFIRSVPNNLFQRFPGLFLNENEFLFAPERREAAPDAKATIVRVNVASNEAAPFAAFVLPASQRPRGGPPVVIRGLTPMVEMARDEASGEVYFGHSGQYLIHAADETGRVIRSFGLDREPMTIGIEAKRRHFEDLGWPPQRIQRVVPGLPDRLTSFVRIQVIDGLIYVFPTTGLGRRQEHLQIDIFSEEGKFLYTSTIPFSDDGGRRSHPENIAIRGNHLYAILADEDGRSTLVRFDLTLPPGVEAEENDARNGAP